MRLPALPWIAGIAVAWRVGLAIAGWAAHGDFRAWSLPDTPSYVAPARSLAESGAFAIAGRPELMRTPGYPLLLVPGVALDQVHLVTFALQLGLSVATLATAAWMTMQWTGSERAGRWAALLYALDPLSATYTALLMPETLFTCLSTLGIGQAATLHRGDWRRGALAGGLLGAAALVRPIGVYLWVAVALALMIRRPRPATSALAALALAAMLIPAAWRVRNYVETGYSGLASITEINAYFYSAAATLAAQQDRPYREVQKELGYLDEPTYLARHPEQREWNEAQRSAFYRREAWNILSGAPATYAGIHLAGTVRLLLDPGSTDLLGLLGCYESSGLLGKAVDEGLVAAVSDLVRRQPGTALVTAVLGLLLAVYYALAALGWARHRQTGVYPWVLLAALVYFAVLSGGPQALARFRIPMMPLMCVMGGAAMAGPKANGSAAPPRA